MDSYEQAKQDFGKSLDFILDSAGDPVVRRVFSKEEVVIVDIGSRAMGYETAFWEWASARHRALRIFAVDHVYAKQPGLAPDYHVTFIASSVENARDNFIEHGVTRIDLLTMFNPDFADPLPDPSSLGELAKGAPLIVACPNDQKTDANAEAEARAVRAVLLRHGYNTISIKRNPYSAALKPSFVFAFDPLLLLTRSLE